MAGPLVGGYITDALSWRWVFYLNLPFGLLAVAVILLAYPPTRRTHAVRVDWLGAALLFAGISALLIALGAETGGGVAAGLPSRRWCCWARSSSWSGACAEPILPLDLLKTPADRAHDRRGVPGRHGAVRRHRVHPAVRAGRHGRHGHRRPARC